MIEVIEMKDVFRAIIWILIIILTEAIIILGGISLISQLWNIIHSTADCWIVIKGYLEIIAVFLGTSIAVLFAFIGILLIALIDLDNEFAIQFGKILNREEE